jgi:hypothetical protein
MFQTSGVTAEVHGFSEAGATPTPWKTAFEQVRALVFCVRPVRGLGFRKGEHPSETTWTFPS